MKHIGIVVPNFPVASETLVITEIQGLIEAGHKVSVFCFNYDATLQHRIPNGVEVVDLTQTQVVNQKFCRVFFVELAENRDVFPKGSVVPLYRWSYC